MEMDADKILTVILDLGRDLIRVGAEVWLVEERLGDIFDAYGFKSRDMVIMSDCLQATVQTYEGTVHTQIREVPGKDHNMDKLRSLSRLSGHILEDIRKGDVPSPELIEEKLEKIRERKSYRKIVLFLAAAFGAANFTMYFNGYRQDVGVVFFVTLFIVFIKDKLAKREDNPLVLNTMLAYIMEILLIASMLLGIGRDLTSQTAGLILLLISGLGLTTGMRDLIHKNVLSGITDFMQSILGAMGIAIGISLALLTFGEDVLMHVQRQEVVHNPTVQLIASIAGAVGFAVVFHCKGRVLLFTSIGVAATYLAYRFVANLTNEDIFLATLFAACVAAFFANVVAFVIKTPPSVFLTTCVCPLLPGSSFYQALYAIIMSDSASFNEHGRTVLLVCVAIALGYIIIEVLFKYTRVIKQSITK